MLRRLIQSAKEVDIKRCNHVLYILASLAERYRIVTEKGRNPEIHC